jgi:hypothetical protein
LLPFQNHLFADVPSCLISSVPNEQLNALAEREALGLSFISLRDNLDLSTPSGRLMSQIIGAMAEFERSLIQERVKAGLRNARAKGKRLGRPRVFVSESKGETQRIGSRSVLARGPDAHHRPPHHSHRGVATVERRGKRIAHDRTAA